MTTKLVSKTCQACSTSTPSLSAARIKTLLQQLHTDWELQDAQTQITRTFTFKGYYRTMAYVNAIAWIAHTEGHHPDMQVSYNQCVVHFMTHAINGLSENDFICAAKVDALLLD